MTKSRTSNIVKSIACGLVIGGAVSAVAMNSMRKPKKSTLKKTTVNAIETVGTIMQSIADYAR